MIRHSDISDPDLHAHVKSGRLTLGGNARLKIYGTLDCGSGKRMKRDTRVFFETENEAVEAGFRALWHLYERGLPGMDLFEPLVDRTANLPPSGGEVYYYGPVLNAADADRYFNELMTGITWRRDTAIMFGRKITTKRKVAWYGDRPFQYAYSGVSRTALKWTPALRELKRLIETESGETYNSCLLNLYHDGSEGMAWHSDDEKDLKPKGAIASLSLGAERKFAMKPKRGGDSWSMMLTHGSLLIMTGATQDNWRHHLPTTKRVDAPRINLTFRTIVG